MLWSMGKCPHWQPLRRDSSHQLPFVVQELAPAPLASRGWVEQACGSPHPGKQLALNHFRLVSGSSQGWVCRQVEPGFPEAPPGLTCVLLPKQNSPRLSQATF